VRLEARLQRRLGPLALDVALEVPEGGTLALVGESGSGKTSTLRMLAGLLRPDSGRISLGGEVWLDTGAGVDVPAWRRAVGYVPQDHGLFPHLDALGNAAFGLRALGVPARAARARALAALERVGVADLAGRRPAALSGGQAQRVALARALVLEPRLVLLDEPLASLDLATRRAVRGEIRRALAGLACATVYVTHSPLEALVFGDRIAVLEGGRIGQSGAAGDLVRHPRSAYVAELMGVNLLRGVVEPHAAGATARLRVGDATLAVVDAGEPGEAFAVVSPREITLARTAPAGSAQNVVRGRIAEIVPEPPFGERLRVVLDCAPPLVAEITPAAAAALGLAEGVEVHAAFKATGVTVFR
jgi:molybdate transport system ATP-binding protein